jgi:hypothetical protein
MVLHLNSKPLFRWIAGRSLGDCPGFEDATELEAQIPVQAPRGVLLDHEDS